MPRREGARAREGDGEIMQEAVFKLLSEHSVGQITSYKLAVNSEGSLPCVA